MRCCGQGGVAEMLMAGVAYLGCCWQGRRAEMLLAGALQRRAIGKMLLAGGTVAEVLMAEAPLQTGRVRRHEPQCL